MLMQKPWWTLPLAMVAATVAILSLNVMSLGWTETKATDASVEPTKLEAKVTTTVAPAATNAVPATVQADATATPAPAATEATVPGTSVANVAAPATELTAKDYFAISQEATDTAGHSKRKCHAVAITLKNNSAQHVEILQGEVVNGLNEATIAQAEQRARQRTKNTVGFLMRAASAAPGIGMLGATSYNSAYALAQTSRALSMASNVASGVVGNTASGDLEISGQFVNKVSNVIISPNQTFTFKALVPSGSDAQLKLIFKNLENNKILEL